MGKHAIANRSRTMKRLLLLILECLLAWGAGPRAGAALPAAPAPPRETGYPLIRNHTPRSYGADSQNWAVLQGPRGVIYAGNNRGVLEYDGVRWRLIRTPKRSVVRSLGMDGAGRVYVGAVGEIGYLGPDAQGLNGFVSLMNRLPEEVRTFSDVWATLATPQGLLFQTREYLFLLGEDRVQVVKAATTFHLAFLVAGRIFVRQRDVGLQELQDGQLKLVPGGERFAGESIFTMLPLGGEGKGILVGTRGHGLWRLDATGLSRFASPAEAFLKQAALYGGARLSDGTLALATIKRGVVILDAQGEVRGILDRHLGLQGDNVKALSPDRDSGLWLALDNGLSRVEWPSPFSQFDDRCGLPGTVWAIQRFQGRLYVATGQGAFILGTSGTGAEARACFQPIAGVNSQSLAFLPWEDRLLMAGAQGVFELQGTQARLIRPSSNVAISLHRSKRQPSHLFLGMQGGLVLMEQGPGPRGWSEWGIVPGVTEDVYSMAEDEQGRLWLGTGSLGALRISFPQGWPRRSTGAAPRVERFGTAEGVPQAVQPYLFTLGGGVLAATTAGMLQFDEGSGRFRVDSRFAALFPEGPRALKAVRVDERNRIWMDTLSEATGLHETGVAIPGADGTLRWEAAPYRRFAETAIEAIQVEASGVAWFGGPSGVLRFDPALLKPGERGPTALIRRVTSERGLIFGADGPQPQGATQEPELPFTKGALRFDFASPSFDLESATQYQVRLEGYESEWSSWSPDAQKDYTNLPGGRYCFRVRARDIFGQVSPEEGFRFRVLRPWYRSLWAYLLYLAGVILLGFFGVRLGTRFLRQRNLALQRRVDLATEELRDRERLLATQAGSLERMNSQLLELNEQKNRFLGIVAHDLRNPLTSILLTSQLIEEEVDLQEIRRRAQNITREGAGMESLIGTFLDLAALETGDVRTEPGPLAVAQALAGLLQRHGPSAEAKGISLVRDFGNTQGRVFADAKFVSAVLDNLLSNAIKFSPRDSVVTIRLEEHHGQVRVAIQDQGPGLTEADRRELFGRFARLSARPTGGEPSVGLGLSIAKQMVEACGGRIWVESEPGQGATFLVELPASEF